MRYSEIVELTKRRQLLKTVTLYVLENEWDCLQDLLKQHSPAEITAVRPLCRFSGLSVDVRCQSPEVASTPLGAWHDQSVRTLCQTASEINLREEWPCRE